MTMCGLKRSAKNPTGGWRTIFGIVVVVLAFCAASVIEVQAQAQYQGRRVVPNEVIVKPRVTAGPDRATALLSIFGAADIQTARPLSDGTVVLLRSTRSVDSLMQTLSGHPDVAYVEPNYIVQAIAFPNDPEYGRLYGLSNTGQSIAGSAGTPGADIGAEAAWNISTGSRAVTVGVVDTGIACTHPDLAANCWSAPLDFSVTIGGEVIDCPAGTHGFNAITRTCDGTDDHGHGTHVAGTIGATGDNGTGVVGVNWNVGLMALKMMNASGSGTTDEAIDAIEFAIQAKLAFAATGGADIRVLNNSWVDSEFSQSLMDEIIRANAHGMLFVAAAGNSGRNIDTQPVYPASYNVDNLVAVAATDNRDGLASFSNVGPLTVHLGAPGVDVYSTVPGGYQFSSGTSMATPHVAGAAALVLSRCDLTTAELKHTLLTTVDFVPSLASTVSGGRLNVARAINLCESAVPTMPDGFIARSPMAGQVDLTWNDRSSNEQRFEIVRDDSEIVAVVSVPANVTSASFEGLNPVVSYLWSLRACAAICSGPTPVISKTPDGSDGVLTRPREPGRGLAPRRHGSPNLDRHLVE